AGRLDRGAQRRRAHLGDRPGGHRRSAGERHPREPLGPSRPRRGARGGGRVSARHDGGTPGDDDESLDRWEDELADLDWDEDEFDLSNEDEDGEVPLDDEGRPLRGTGSLAPVWQRAIARLVDVFIIFNVAGFLAYVIVRPPVSDAGLM